MAEIQTVSQRARLAVRREPHWHKLGNGQFIGFRKMTPSSGQWHARYRDPTSLKQEYKSLGDFGHIRDAEKFTAAKKEAEEWFMHLGRGGSNDTFTIKDVCVAYVKNLATEKSQQSAKDAERRFQQYVLDDKKFASIEIEKLQEAHLRSWLSNLKSRPTASGPNKGSARSQSSLNRDITPLRSALNFAYKSKLTTNRPWEEVLKPKSGADKKRQVILDKSDQQKLLEACPTDFGILLRALIMLPIRPGAMAKLKVKDFDKTTGTLTINSDKAGEGRMIGLPKGHSAFFTSQLKNKLPTAYIFSQSNGKQWGKDSWKKLFKNAALKSKINKKATLYCLRHTGITSLIENNLPTLSVAQLSGTSIRMIELNYGHLTDRMSRQALSKLFI